MSLRTLVIAQALSTWRYVLLPTRNPTPVQAVINALYVIPRWAVQGLLMLLDHLTLRATRRAEYQADSVAARAGSTEAAVALMDRLLVSDSAETVLLRESNSGQVIRAARDTEGQESWRRLWDQLAAHMESIPGSEHERQRRAGALRGHSVDSTHPPTHLRRAALLAGPPLPATVFADPSRQTAIRAELAKERERLARRILRGN